MRCPVTFFLRFPANRRLWWVLFSSKEQLNVPIMLPTDSRSAPGLLLSPCLMAIQSHNVSVLRPRH